MTSFRYDVTLHLDKEPLPPNHDVARLEWSTQRSTMADIRQFISESKCANTVIAGVPNARLLLESQILSWLNHSDGPETVGELRDSINGVRARHTRAGRLAGAGPRIGNFGESYLDRRRELRRI